MLIFYFQIVKGSLFWLLHQKLPIFRKKVAEKGKKYRIFFKKPIDKRQKTRYNLNEPNGSKRKITENGGGNEVKEHHLLCDDS